LRSVRGARVLPLVGPVEPDMPVELLPLLMEPEDAPVPVVLLPVPVAGALLPMVPGVVPMLPDVLLPVTPVVELEPVPEVEPMLPELVEPLELPVAPVLLPVPAPVVLGLVAVLGPTGAGTPGVAPPMPVLLGLSVAPEVEDWA
jgi:signal-induced proliferation-associated 1 like protein 3